MKSPNTLTADEINKLIEKAGDELKNKPASFYTEMIDWLVEHMKKDWIDAYLHNYNKNIAKNRDDAAISMSNFIYDDISDSLVTYKIGENRYLGDELDEIQFKYADSLSNSIAEIVMDKYDLYEYFKKKYDKIIDEFEKSVAPTKLKEDNNISRSLPILDEIKRGILKEFSKLSKFPSNEILCTKDWEELDGNYNEIPDVVLFKVEILGYETRFEIKCKFKSYYEVESVEITPYRRKEYISLSVLPYYIKNKCLEFDWKGFINNILHSFAPAKLKENIDHTLPLKEDVTSVDFLNNQTFLLSLGDEMKKYFDSKISTTSLKETGVEVDFDWQLSPVDNNSAIDIWLNGYSINAEESIPLIEFLNWRLWFVSNDGNIVLSVVEESEEDKDELERLFSFLSENQQSEMVKFLDSISSIGLKDYVNKWLKGTYLTKLKEDLLDDIEPYVPVLKNHQGYFSKSSIASNTFFQTLLHNIFKYLEDRIPTSLKLYDFDKESIHITWDLKEDSNELGIYINFSPLRREDETQMYSCSFTIEKDKNGVDKIVSNSEFKQLDIPPKISSSASKEIENYISSINLKELVDTVNKNMNGFDPVKLREDKSIVDISFIKLNSIFEEIDKYFRNKAPEAMRDNLFIGHWFITPNKIDIFVKLRMYWDGEVYDVRLYTFSISIEKNKDDNIIIGLASNKKLEINTFLNDELPFNLKDLLNDFASKINGDDFLKEINGFTNSFSPTKLKESLIDSQSANSNIVDVIDEHIESKVNEVDNGFLKDKLYLDSNTYTYGDKVRGVEVIVYCKVPQTQQAYRFVSLYIQMIDGKFKVEKNNNVDNNFLKYLKVGLNSLKAFKINSLPTEETNRIIKDVQQLVEKIDDKEIQDIINSNPSPTKLKEDKDEINYSNDNAVKEFYTKNIDKWLDYYKNHIVKYVAVHKDEWGKIKDSEFIQALLDNLHYDLFQHLFYEVSSKLDLPPTRSDEVMERIEDIVNDAYSLYDLNRYIETSLINRVKDIIRDFTPTKLKESLSEIYDGGMFSFKDGILTIKNNYIFPFLDITLAKMVTNSFRSINFEEDMNRVKKLIIPPQITTIMHDALSFWMDLEEVEFMPDSKLEVIQNDAFEGCRKLNKINLNSLTHLTHIGDSAFWGCTSLTRIDIPEGVTFIGPSVFGDCERLEEISLPSTLTNLSTRIIGDVKDNNTFSIKHIYLNSSKGKVDIKDKFLEYASKHNYLYDIVDPHIFISVKLKEEKLDEAPDAWGIETPIEISREIENKIKQSNLAKIKVITKIKNLLAQLQNEGKLNSPKSQNWGGVTIYNFDSNVTAKELNDIFASHKDILPEMNGPHPFNIRDYNTMEWRYSLPVIIEDVRELNRTPSVTGMTVSEFTEGEFKGKARVTLMLTNYTLELMERQPVKLK